MRRKLAEIRMAKAMKIGWPNELTIYCASEIFQQNEKDSVYQIVSWAFESIMPVGILRQWIYIRFYHRINRLANAIH